MIIRLVALLLAIASAVVASPPAKQADAKLDRAIARRGRRDQRIEQCVRRT